MHAEAGHECPPWNGAALAPTTALRRGQAGPVESRTFRVQGSSMRSTSLAAPLDKRRIRRRQAAEAKSSTGCATVVR